MLCDLIQCEYSLPVETDFSNIGPLLNSVSNGAPLEITCGQVFFFFSPSCRLCEYSEAISTGFKVVVMGCGHKAAAFLPAQLRLLRQPEPVRKPFSWIVV